MALFSLVVNGSAMVFAEPIASVLLDFDEGKQLLKLLLISAFLKGIANIPYKKLIITKKAKTYISVNFIYVVLTLSLTVYFVVSRQMGIAGILYAQIIGACIQLVTLGIITFETGITAFSTPLLNEMLKFSIYLILPNLSAFLINIANRYFLEEYQGLHEVGIYSLGAKIASIIPLLLTNPFKKVLGPHIYSLAGETEKCKSELVRHSGNFLLAIILLSLFLSLFTRELIGLISADSYMASYIIVPLLSLSHIMYGYAGIVVLGIHITKKTKVITLIFLVSSLFSLLFNYLLIPAYGMLGAAIANILSIMLVFTGYLITLNRYYPVTFRYGNYIGLLAGAVVVYLVSLFDFNALLVNIIYKTGLFTVFIVLVLLSNYLERNDKQFVLRKILRIQKV
jgi:O-antigen/teichoic acid export membrane protein